MVKLIDGKYKFIENRKNGENVEFEVVIDKSGNLLAGEYIFTFDYKNSSFKNDNNRFFINEIFISELYPPHEFELRYKDGEEMVTGILKLIDDEKLNALDKKEKRKEKRKEKLIYYSIFFVLGLIFILFFYTGLVNNNLISNKFLSNKIFKITSKIFNLLNIFLISLIIPTLIILIYEN